MPDAVTRASARNTIYSHSTAAINAVAASILSVPMKFRYGGIVDKTTPENDKYWARVSTQVVDEEQETLRNSEFARRFVTTGLVFVQLFSPVIDINALLNTDLLAEGIRNAFRAYSSGETIEFTMARITDNIPPEPDWLRINISCTYQYRQFM